MIKAVKVKISWKCWVAYHHRWFIHQWTVNLKANHLFLWFHNVVHFDSTWWISLQNSWCDSAAGQVLTYDQSLPESAVAHRPTWCRSLQCDFVTSWHSRSAKYWLVFDGGWEFCFYWISTSFFFVSRVLFFKKRGSTDSSNEIYS